jgi:hypothetical protein
VVVEDCCCGCLDVSKKGVGPICFDFAGLFRVLSPPRVQSFPLLLIGSGASHHMLVFLGSFGSKTRLTLFGSGVFGLPIHVI